MYIYILYIHLYITYIHTHLYNIYICIFNIYITYVYMGKNLWHQWHQASKRDWEELIKETFI